MVVGLTGRYCAGKDAVARLLGRAGFEVVDADALSHEVLAEKSEQVIGVFGESARAPDGTVDRRALGRVVFADPAARTRLEGILYPTITERILRFISSTPRDVLINAPLLQRAGLERLCAAVVFVTAPVLVRLVRAMRRDSLPPGEAWARVNAQKDVRPQSIGTAVDTYSMANWGSMRSLERRVSRLVRDLKG